MSRVRDHRQPGTRDCGGKGSGRLANVHDILVAIDDQGWSGDLRQPLGGGRVEGDLLASLIVASEERGVHLSHPLAHLGIDRIGTPIRAVHPHSELVFDGAGDIPSLVELVHSLPSGTEGSRHRRPGPRRDGDEGRDPLGRGDCRLDRRLAPHRDADDMRPRDPEMIQQPDRVRVGGEGRVRLAGLAKPTGIEADHGEVFGEGRNLSVPHPAVADPGMKQEHGRPTAGHVIRDLGHR